jgi:RNA 2',3'-cyclic 3'-phosphodiesterase
MRTFVAIDVGGPLDPARQGRDEAPEHLTLRFLGEISEDRVPVITTALRNAVRPLTPFDLTFEGVGAFPGPRNPRVVWVGATVGRERAIELARAVESALVPFGFPAEDKEFVPHVTLFRVRGPRDSARARRLLDGGEPAPAARSVRVTEVTLKASALTRDGPIHRVVGTAPLGG